MLNSPAKHLKHLVKKTWKTFKALLKRQISLWLFFHELFVLSRAFIEDILRPPATAEHKSAVKRVNTGVAYYNDKHYLDALHVFLSAIELDPHYSRAYMYLGNAHYKLKEHAEAAAAWERAIRVDPLSEAADKARMKLEHLRAKTHQAINELEEQIAHK